MGKKNKAKDCFGVNLVVEENERLETLALLPEYTAYPMFLVHRDDVMSADSFVSHEQAWRAKALYQMVRVVVPYEEYELKKICEYEDSSYGGHGLRRGGDDSTVTVTRGELVFVSHHWREPDQPDDEQGTVLRQLQRLLKMNNGLHYVWLAYSCTPQLDQAMCSSHFQHKALRSLFFYIRCAGHFYVLVQSMEQGTKVTDPGSLESFESRAWCRLERFLSSAAKSKRPKNLRKTQASSSPHQQRLKERGEPHAHHGGGETRISAIAQSPLAVAINCLKGGSVTEVFFEEPPRNPLKGAYSNPKDRPVMATVMRRLVDVLAAGNDTGNTGGLSDVLGEWLKEYDKSATGKADSRTLDD